MELNCTKVSFRYGRRHALDEVSMTLRPGVTGLLGPNGAGKSTLLSILATLRKPSEGSVCLDGRSLHGDHQEDLRSSIGFLPQRFDLMGWSSAVRNVSYAAWAQGVERDECHRAAISALGAVDLVEQANRRVGSLSGGQQQRVGIACAIAHRPDIVLLDEPTAGLDPAQRVQIRSYLAKIAESAIVLLSTHIVEDLALMASDLVVIEGGRLTFTGSVDTLIEAGERNTITGMSALESGYMGLLSTAQSTTEARR
jgi:ABC-2 type transport system ATP-binding protein